MIASVNLRLWCDWSFLRNRRAIAKALLGYLKPRDLTTAVGLSKVFDEIMTAFQLGLLEPWRDQAGDFLYACCTHDHKVDLPSFLAVMRLLHGWPYEYDFNGRKIISKGKSISTLDPPEEARYMAFAITVKAIVEELRELEMESRRAA